MEPTEYDPTDHARTTLPRAGEGMKDSRSLGGYALMGLAVLALSICIGAAARGVVDWTVGAGIVAVVTATAGSVWVYVGRRRVARVAQQHAQSLEHRS